ncbi:hypothetical protein VOLCADRAFT_116086 [Volvox carteri f. nagariensis]|uniref:DUF7912 domain-containing protein n=1 Tax=Volvox carteri f. nagariensis TaxID=3068 RepID=D8TJS4_VOLCA|nr:uncharacterized protein VOLCADRAFT_116086 [Volvox carteri f. nagariensis]EFJ52593.1 hypothetical protein VOLCADRAFT_116086 [Volvox carteri f. nagariensis]|eukprot:XP_002946666.1 hypothetical protein VOLCADRAFT_116086 [Volvox carteri f. nagariensis]
MSAAAGARVAGAMRGCARPPAHLTSASLSSHVQFWPMRQPNRTTFETLVTQPRQLQQQPLPHLSYITSPHIPPPPPQHLRSLILCTASSKSSGASQAAQRSAVEPRLPTTATDPRDDPEGASSSSSSRSSSSSTRRLQGRTAVPAATDGPSWPADGRPDSEDRRSITLPDGFRDRAHQQESTAADLGGGAAAEEEEEEEGAGSGGDGGTDGEGEYDEDEYDEDGEDEDEGDDYAGSFLEPDDAPREVATGGTTWGEVVLRAAQEVLAKPPMKGLELYLFRALPATRKVDIRLDKLDDLYGSPSIDDIERFQRGLLAALEREMGPEAAGEISFEVSSPGAERLVRVPEELPRFAELPLQVEYRTPDGKEVSAVLLLAGLDPSGSTSSWRLANVRANATVKGRALSKKQLGQVLTLALADIVRHPHQDLLNKPREHHLLW